MDPAFESIMFSRQFRFRIGKDKEEFSIHEAAVAEQSTALNALMTGGMTEAREGVVDWEDCERGTWLRFAQFCYTGEYSIPAAVRIEEPLPVVQEEPVCEPDILVFGSSKKGLKKERKKKKVSSWEWEGEPVEESPAPEAAALTDDEILSPGEAQPTYSPPRPSAPKFSSINHPRPQPQTKYDASCLIVPASKDQESFQHILLCHAQLYVLADKWGIETLTALTLHKMQKTLSGLPVKYKKASPYAAAEVNPIRANDIVELISYLYSDEGTPDLNEGIDKMRELVCAFVARETWSLMESERMLGLMEEGGLFVRDLMGFLRSRFPDA